MRTEPFRRRPSGFTLIEVLLATFVLGTSLAAVVVVGRMAVRYGSQAQSESTGLATAMSVLYDPKPLSPSPTGANLDFTTSLHNDGFLNGFYVTRTVTAPAAGSPGLTLVTVRVYAASDASGDEVATVSLPLMVRP